MIDPLEIIIALLRDKFESKEVLNDETKLSDAGLDSLDVINFLFSLEEKTGASIPDAALVEEPLETLGQLAAYIQRQVG